MVVYVIVIFWDVMPILGEMSEHNMNGWKYGIPFDMTLDCV